MFKFKKIGVIGTRKRNTVSDYLVVKETFFEYYQDRDWIVSGHCPTGGDAFAEKIAFDYGIPILLFPPKKKKREEFFARNTLIAKHSDILIACLVDPHEPLVDIVTRKTGGSEDTIRKFVKELSYIPKSVGLSMVNEIRPEERVIIV